jgi:hypothetical protein
VLVTETPIPIDDNTRKIVVGRLAAHYDMPAEQAAAMLDDVIQHGKASPHVAQVWNVVGRMLRPFIDEIKAVMETPDPLSPEAVARVVAVAKATIPELENPPTS